MHPPLKNLMVWSVICTTLMAGLLFSLLIFCTQDFFITKPERELTRTPIGRVHAGARFEQVIEIPNLDSTKPAGLSLCLATYMETNSGQLQISITQQNYQADFTLDASKIVDNDWVFLPLPETMKPGKAVIKIAGANNTAESAPTVWANEPANQNPLLENGTPTNKHLEVRFFVVKSPWTLLVDHVRSESIAAVLVVLFSVTTGCTMGVLIGVIAVHAFHKRALMAQ